jgi:hypothetical protein
LDEIRSEEFFDKLRTTIIINAIGASVLRNQGAPIIQTVRDFLGQLNPRMFADHLKHTQLKWRDLISKEAYHAAQR